MCCAQASSQTALFWSKAIIRPGVLINNASTFYSTNIQNATFENWDDLHDVNLKAPFFISKFFYKSLKNNKGCIINIIDIRLV